jgi:hypothetical protein
MIEMIYIPTLGGYYLSNFELVSYTFITMMTGVIIACVCIAALRVDKKRKEKTKEYIKTLKPDEKAKFYDYL